jgi:hypothetical protein
MKTVRGAAQLSSVDSDRSDRAQNKNSFRRERFSGESMAELGGSKSLKRRPYYVLKCFAVAVCGSVSLIALTVFVWSYHLDFQALKRSRFELEQKVQVLKEQLRTGEYRSGKLKDDANAQTPSIFSDKQSSKLDRAESSQPNTSIVSPVHLPPKQEEVKPADSPW